MTWGKYDHVWDDFGAKRRWWHVLARLARRR